MTSGIYSIELKVIYELHYYDPNEFGIYSIELKVTEKQATATPELSPGIYSIELKADVLL